MEDTGDNFAHHENRFRNNDFEWIRIEFGIHSDASIHGVLDVASLPIISGGLVTFSWGHIGLDVVEHFLGRALFDQLVQPAIFDWILF